jgi:hypothetical protein
LTFLTEDLRVLTGTWAKAAPCLACARWRNGRRMVTLVRLVHAGERTVDGALDTAGNGRRQQLIAASARQLGQTEVVKRGARAVDGSGTCRRKARLYSRHTSDGVCAAAQSKQPQVHLDHSGLARFFSTARRPTHRVGERTQHAHLGVLAAAVNSGEDGEAERRRFGSR